MLVPTNLTHKEFFVATVKKKQASKATKEALQRHPLSEKYGPKIDDDELLGLSLDIKRNHQHEPIIMFEGMVLAGWSRYQACLKAGVEPLTRDMPADSNPIEVAFGTNFMRRKLSSIQKAFFGAQYVVDTSEKQADIAKRMSVNLNRLNQCCQLLKLSTPEAKAAVESLRDSADMGSAQFDDLMLQIGIARQPKPAPARASARGNGALGDDDDDPLGGEDFDVDDLTGGEIDNLLGDGEELGDEETPDPAKRKPRSGPVGDDEPIPPVGGKRTSMANPHETPVSRVAKAFRALSQAEQRQFVKFAWKPLRIALDAALGGADVEYTPPDTIKADPSRIVPRNRKADDPLDDGAPAPAAKSKGKGKAAAPAKAPAKSKGKGKAAKPTPAKKSTPRSAKHDEDI